MLFDKNRNNKKEISFFNKQNREKLTRTTRSNRSKDKINLFDKKELEIVKPDGTKFTVKIGDILKCNYYMSNSINSNYPLKLNFFYVKITREFFTKNYEFQYTISEGLYRRPIGVPLGSFILIEKHNIEHVKAITQLENNN